MGYTLIIDNYDSFTWNVYADVAVLGGNPLVKRNDKIGIDEIQVGPSASVSEQRRGHLTATMHGVGGRMLIPYRGCLMLETLIEWSSVPDLGTLRPTVGLAGR